MMTFKCKQCGKTFPKRHPLQKFCTHKGVGNCKDTWHNENTPGRNDYRYRECEDPGDDAYYGAKDEEWGKPW